MISPKLLQAYLSTRYAIQDKSLNCSLSIGDINSVLNEFLVLNKVSSWAIITAFNPYSKIRSDTQNTHSNEQLLNKLKEHQYTYLESKAIDPLNNWPIEDGYMILNISFTSAVSLAKSFKQNAIIFGETHSAPKLIDCLVD